MVTELHDQVQKTGDLFQPMSSSPPDLVHEDQSSLEGIVDGVIGRICNGLGSHLLSPHFEIVIP